MKPWVIMKQTPSGSTQVSFKTKKEALKHGNKWLEYRRVHDMAGSLFSLLKQKKLKSGKLQLQHVLKKSLRKKRSPSVKVRMLKGGKEIAKPFGRRLRKGDVIKVTKLEADTLEKYRYATRVGRR